MSPKKAELDAIAQDIHFLVDVLLYEGMTHRPGRSRPIDRDLPPLDLDRLQSTLNAVRTQLEAMVNFPLPEREDI